MWAVASIETNEHVLDFSTSEQGRHQSKALIADGVELINAIELVEFSPERTQLIVCEQCGFVHCKRGDWVQIRRIEDSILLVPAFAEMEKGNWERDEYSPPKFIKNRGIPVFDGNLSLQLLEILNEYQMVSVQDLKPLSPSELCKAMQWEAPAHVLGKYPDRPKLDRSRILYCEPIELSNAVDLLDRHIEVLATSEQQLHIDQTAVSVKFYLDRSIPSEWSPIAIAENGAIQVRIDDSHSIAF
jgi:hypothetical protein